MEVQWFKFLAKELELYDLSDEQMRNIDEIAADFSIDDAQAVKNI